MNNREYSKAIKNIDTLGPRMRSEAFEYARVTRDMDGLRDFAERSEEAADVYYDILADELRKIAKVIDTSSPGLRVADLCCGAGMASMGMEAAGFFTMLGVDIKGPMIDAFRLNHPSTGALWCGVEDIVELAARGVKIPRVDVVITGPPCQDDLPRGRCNWSQKAACESERGKLKGPALDAARLFRPEYIVMETTGRLYADWAKENGEIQSFWLIDADYGGYTSRRRNFHIWGDTVIDIPMSLMVGSPGWGAAATKAGIQWRPESRMGSEANAKNKRFDLLRAPGEPAPTVVGGGRALVIVDEVLYGEKGRRIQPLENGFFQGFDNLRLAGTYRDQRIQVGNGWPKSFGYVIGQALVAALSR